MNIDEKTARIVASVRSATAALNEAVQEAATHGLQVEISTVSALRIDGTKQTHLVADIMARL